MHVTCCMCAAGRGWLLPIHSQTGKGTRKEWATRLSLLCVCVWEGPEGFIFLADLLFFVSGLWATFKRRKEITQYHRNCCILPQKSPRHKVLDRCNESSFTTHILSTVAYTSKIRPINWVRYWASSVNSICLEPTNWAGHIKYICLHRDTFSSPMWPCSNPCMSSLDQWLLQLWDIGGILTWTVVTGWKWVLV